MIKQGKGYGRWLLSHPESDQVFEVFTLKEYKSALAGGCEDVTGSAYWERIYHGVLKVETTCPHLNNICMLLDNGDQIGICSDCENQTFGPTQTFDQIGIHLGIAKDVHKRNKAIYGK